METYERSSALSQTGVTARFASALFFATATAVCARLAFHLWYTPIPVTLQVLGVILSGLVLGKKWGAVSQIQYLVLGLMGFPVFAGGLAGPAAFAAPDGGYLFGFVAGAYLAGYVYEILKERTSFAAWIAGTAGMLGVYALGASWLAIWLGFAAGRSLQGSIAGAWQLGIVPFIGIDFLKAMAASALAFGGRSGRGVFEAVRNL
ncbi:MAG TPA: biotin transporter BioY [Armatimonadota bacterium]|jgi:biotin transport system substrate-specific component